MQLSIWAVWTGTEIARVHDLEFQMSSRLVIIRLLITKVQFVQFSINSLVVGPTRYLLSVQFLK